MYPNSNKIQKLEINANFEFFQGGCIASLDPVLPEFSPWLYQTNQSSLTKTTNTEIIQY